MPLTLITCEEDVGNSSSDYSVTQQWW